MIAEGQVGAQNIASGQAPIRLTRDTSVGVALTRARYAEAVIQKNVFTVATPVAGVDHGATITTTSPFWLQNPATSGVNLEIIDFTFGYVSGTLGAGSLVIVADLAGTITASGGTAVTSVQNYLSNVAGKAKPFSGATLSAAPTYIEPAIFITAMLATTAVLPNAVVCSLDGKFVVPPGMSIGIAGVCGAAGTTPKILIGCTWAEVTTP